MNVLAVRQDNNGDVLLAGPAIRALAAHASVTLVCGPSGANAAATQPGVAPVIVFEAAWIEAEPRPFDAPGARVFVTEIGRAQIDAALIFTSFHQSALPMALLLRLAGVARTAAISTDYAEALLDVRHRVDDDRHEVERALSLAAAAGFAPSANDDGRLAMATARHKPAAPAVVVTGAGRERQLCAFVAAGGACDLAGQTDFATLARVIADADAIVVGNTGAAHVAAAVNLDFAAEIRQAIERSELRIVYQPILRLRGTTIVGFGALVRSQHPRRASCADAVHPEG